MACHILVGNKAGDSGEISSVTNPKENYTHNETLNAWLLKYPSRPVTEYHRNFSLVKVSDKTKEDLAYLTSHLVKGDLISNKWYFVSPSSDTSEWLELFQTGEITKTFAEVLPYIRERI
tara:strand:- start:525 stop:881 length:357 start_codon:yes stop_codon:yes gene_type:complete